MIVEAVTDAKGVIVRADLLAAAEGVHRQQRPQAHKFHFREGLAIGAFHLTKSLR